LIASIGAFRSSFSVVISVMPCPRAQAIDASFTAEPSRRPR
jgi:hypothetical protein